MLDTQNYRPDGRRRRRRRKRTGQSLKKLLDGNNCKIETGSFISPNS
jgi:hypothetical protein